MHTSLNFPALGACHNSIFLPNSKMPSSKCVIWNRPRLRNLVITFCLHHFQTPFWQIFFRFWQIKIKIYGLGAADYLRTGDQCAPWLRCGGKSMDLGIWNKNRSRNEIKKQPVLTCQFFLNLYKTITGLSICNCVGTDLAVPNTWLFGRLSKNSRPIKTEPNLRFV